MTAAGVRFRLRVQPRAARDAVDGVRDGELVVRVAAPPVDGAANEAVVQLLARELGVARTSVRVVVGARGRRKIVAVEGVSAEALDRRWPGLGV